MYFKHLDIISPSLTFHYKNYHCHSSVFSSFLSLIVIILCISATVYFSLDIIDHLNPTSFFYYHQEYDVGHFPINESSMFHFINFIGVPKEENSESLFEVFGFMKTYISNYKNNIGSRLLIDHYTYGACDKKSQNSKLNNIQNAFLETTFESMEYCINGFYNATTKNYITKDNPNFEYPIMSHGTSHPNYTSYSIIVQRCENDTFFKMNKCKSEEYIDDFVTHHQLDAVMAFLNQESDVLNYSYPIKHKFISITFSFTVGTFSVSNLNFQPMRVNTHNGFFFDNIVVQNSFYYEQNDIKNYETKFKIYTSFHLWMQNKVQIYERSYKRIQNVIADTGGMIKAITTLASIINILAYKYQTYIDIESIIMNKFDGANKTRTFHKFSNLGITYPIISKGFNERKDNSIKIDNFTIKEHNSQNYSMNNSFLLPMNIQNSKKYNDVNNRDSRNYLFIKENKGIKHKLGFFNITWFLLFGFGKVRNKNEKFIDIIKWYYRNVISEQNMFDLYFYSSRLENNELKLGSAYLNPVSMLQNVIKK